MKLKKTAREYLDALNRNTCEMYGAYSEIVNELDDDVATVIGEYTHLTGDFLNGFQIREGEIVPFDKVSYEQGQKFARSILDKRDWEKVRFRTVPMKIDTDCVFCKSCTDCNWEVRGAGFGRIWMPLCKECALWLLRSHDEIQNEDSGNADC